MLENENNYILSLQTNFVNYLTNLISKNLFYFRILNNEYEIVVLPITLPKILNIYKNHTHLYFKQLIEIAVIDRLTQIDRFKINYILFSQVFNTRLILSIEVNEINNVFSITEFFNSAEWLEREVWDLYGIYFIGNKNLRRIVTDYGFKGHPLRKDFPLTGFLEICYNDEEKKIVYETVELAQEYRIFTLQNRWFTPTLIETITESTEELDSIDVL